MGGYYKSYSGSAIASWSLSHLIYNSDEITFSKNASCFSSNLFVRVHSYIRMLRSLFFVSSLWLFKIKFLAVKHRNTSLISSHLTPRCWTCIKSNLENTRNWINFFWHSSVQCQLSFLNFVSQLQYWKMVQKLFFFSFRWSAWFFSRLV